MVSIDGIVFSLQNSGGISVYFNEILKRMVRDSYPHELILYRNKNKTLDTDSVFIKKIRESHLPIDIQRYLPCFVGDNVIFHSTYYRLPLSKRKNKIITTVHDFTYERYAKGLKLRLHHWQKKKAILNSELIVCISENTKRDLLHFIHGVDEKKIRVIYNGVSLDFFNMSNRKKSSNVIFIGARKGYKNFSEAVLGVSLVKDIMLFIIGGGNLTKKEEEFLEKKLKNRYKFFEYVDNKTLNNIYNDALCLLYPSLYEGFGIPVLEAMKAGCPVIASNSSSIPEIAGDAAILLDTPCAHDIAEAILFISKEENCNKYTKLGLRQAELFSWEKAYTELLNCYQSLET